MIEKAEKFINEFNITVETIDKLLPKWKPTVENLYYDLQSFTEAYRSKNNANLLKTWCLTSLFSFFVVIFPFGVCIGFGLFMFFTMYMIQNFQ